jgi:TPR repeat protein
MTSVGIKALAESGDVQAMLRMAESCEAGIDGCERDILQAAEWYKKAADKKNARAARKLADCYYFSKEAENLTEAVKYYTLAAKLGEPKAMYNLAVLFERGIGAGQDFEEAFKYYLSAAKAGIFNAMYKTGDMYLKGIGTKPDFDKAFMWLNNAAGKEGVSPMAEYALAVCFRDGLGVGRNTDRAIELFQRSASGGNALALTAIGDYYYSRKETDTAKEYYERAAEQMEAGALTRLGNMSYSGDGAPEDIAAALDFYERAAELGDVEAIRTAAKIHGEAEALEIAAGFLARGAELGDIYCMYELALCYCEGKGTAVRPEDAVPILEVCAGRKYAPAEYLLGKLYTEGKGTEKDEIRGKKLIRRAAAQNYAEAENYLHTLDEAKQREKQSK